MRALLAARIDRLAAREKDVLQTAAVIGREFDEPTLAAVVEQDAPQLREALQTLKDAEFVYEHSLSDSLNISSSIRSRRRSRSPRSSRSGAGDSTRPSRA